MYRPPIARSRAACGRVVPAVALVLAAYPASALAHDGAPLAPHDLWRAWNWSPPVLLGVVLAGWLYARGLRALWRRAGPGRGIARRRATAFAAGLVALGVALVSPLDRLGATLFSAHMVQHLALILVAAPLLVLGTPLVPFLWAFPRAARRAFVRRWRRARAARAAWRLLNLPPVAWALHAAVLWAWHLPALYQGALRNEALHALEHAGFLGTALLFWWVLLHPRRQGSAGGAALLHVFAAAVQSTILGALITFSRAPWYPLHAAGAAAWGLTPLEDQQLAGLIMWIPAGPIYLLAALALFANWLGALERATRRREDRARRSPPRASGEASGAFTRDVASY